MSKINCSSSKRLLFSEMPCDFVYFKQYHISAKLMYDNLLALNTVDPSNQEVITVTPVPQLSLLIYLEIAPLPEQLEKK